MIKKILLVSLLLSGSSVGTMAQISGEETVSAAFFTQKQSMTIGQLFEKIEENSKSLRTVKSGVEAAGFGVESAKSKRLPDLDASLSFSYIGNALLTDRDFSNVHGLSSPHFGNNFAFQAQQVVYAGVNLRSDIDMPQGEGCTACEL
jgi:outer membrane protein